jgi:hypothetical protein
MRMVHSVSIGKLNGLPGARDGVQAKQKITMGAGESAVAN